MQSKDKNVRQRAPSSVNCDACQVHTQIFDPRHCCRFLRTKLIIDDQKF